MVDRRTVLLFTVAAGATAALPALARNGNDAASAQLDRLLAAFFEENLRLNPERATQLGFDKGANSALKSRLSDASVAGIAAVRASTQQQLRRLRGIDASRLGAADRLSYDVVLYTLQSAAAVQRFDFGGSTYGPSPYVVSQLTGAYQAVPDFLDTKHTIDTSADADAYLSRLSAFATQLDANTAQMRHDGGMGVVPPDFLLDTTLVQLEKTRVPADRALVVTSIARRTAAKGLAAHYGHDAAKIYREKVLPALDRQIAEARRMRAHATHDAGVWKFQQGASFYEVALRATTTTRFTPDEVHRLGLEQAKAISARLDSLLKARGLTQGTVGERMAHLYADPSQLYPNTDAGKAQAIAYGNNRLAAIRPRLPRVFHRIPQYRFEVRRVPPQTEAGAPFAFSQTPAIDGSRPGLVYLNLHDSAEWPKFAIPTTVFHEGLPGHQFEGGLALSNTRLPLIRKTGGFSGYAEGWALYAEQLSDEIGMYDDDPLGRLGYLRAQLFRANRCVVDTGIHHLRWGREQAIDYFVAQDGDARGAATREVERYCSTPGQACSYKLGHTVFIGLRANAKQRLGAKFDIKDFHDAVLSCGRVPLDILQRVGEDWLKTQSA
jgi:uncharacterized protein (DUF885 family)